MRASNVCSSKYVALHPRFELRTWDHLPHSDLVTCILDILRVAESTVVGVTWIVGRYIDWETNSQVRREILPFNTEENHGGAATSQRMESISGKL